MYFESLNAALLMDGHGAYVWSAYLITGLVVAAILLLPRRREARVLRQLAGDLRRQRAAEGDAGEPDPMKQQPVER